MLGSLEANAVFLQVSFELVDIGAPGLFCATENDAITGELSEVLVYIMSLETNLDGSLHQMCRKS